MGEDALLNEAIADGNARDSANPTDRGGTNPMDRQAILEKHEIESEIVPTTEENLAEAIRENKGIVANVDAGELWQDPQYSGGGHAIMVYDGDFDNNGNLTHVYINDTGSGQQGRRMEIGEFMEAANSKEGGSSLNVTMDPVWR